MRSVAAVVALVACVHAGLWSLLQRQQAVLDFGGVLPSISYDPHSYSRSEKPEEGPPPTADQRKPCQGRSMNARPPYPTALTRLPTTRSGFVNILAG